MGCQHVFNLPIKTSSVTASFSNRDASLASLHQFLFSNDDPTSLKNSLIHEKCVQISNGACLFDISVNDVDPNELVLHVKIHFLLIATSAQRTESEIKEASLRKATSRSELNTACAHHARSQLIRGVSEQAKIDEECVTLQKKSSGDDANFLPGACLHKNILRRCDSYFDCQHGVEEF